MVYWKTECKHDDFARITYKYLGPFSGAALCMHGYDNELMMMTTPKVGVY